MSYNTDKKLRVHYFLQDTNNSNIHSMNAYIHQRCSYEILEILKLITEVIDINLLIEIEPLAEGGIKEIFKFCFDKLSDWEQKIVLRIIIYIPILLGIKWGFLKIQEQELINEKLRLEIAKFNLPYHEDVLPLLERILKNPQFAVTISNIYKNLEDEDKVYQISFALDKEKGSEIFVPKKDFPTFILPSNISEEVNVFESAIVEILMPNLTTEKDYKWKGKFFGEFITLQMSDQNFKEEVNNKKIVIEHGFHVLCSLEKTQKIEMIANDIKYKAPSYQIKKVLDYKDSLDELLIVNNINIEEYMSIQPITENKLKGENPKNPYDLGGLFDNKNS